MDGELNMTNECPHCTDKLAPLKGHEGLQKTCGSKECKSKMTSEISSRTNGKNKRHPWR